MRRDPPAEDMASLLLIPVGFRLENARPLATKMNTDDDDDGDNDDDDGDDDDDGHENEKDDDDDDGHNNENDDFGDIDAAGNGSNV